ncbi:Predicted ATP-dependent endonuclease of the OLD family, contains P-loop ATPase and TOPRIM domains [Flavobacterium fryxellicola]|uniref:ATP-dependent endonuclease n=1 Tax=Flavobacterium fryxellicola TaxID=249352 RepID=A0A167Y6W9_9FLAO|nr:ATP-dependent endonuclease [Flavobacterium fryxellicola]OAB29088.1 ATP-dependent endonuclease [Flavobacterium fryxellicola]SHN58553.1 Predicted ATP-dependent endonuclease of the OLD family, contains P-loop ATPase and TOPRIM domains [Flavobacterium fryxellicola]
MFISKIKIKNFRLLKDTTLLLNEDGKQELSLLIGRNNSGKTSFIMLFDKFYRHESFKFNFYDFSTSLRNKIYKIDDNTVSEDLSIQMILEIKYDANDSLENISDFILDLDPTTNIVKILFECSIDKDKLIKDLLQVTKNQEKYIEKNLPDYLINKNIYVFENDTDLEVGNRKNLVKKDISSIRNLINFQVIHAKRNVSSSETTGNGKRALSEMTTQYFNKEHKESSADFFDINEAITTMDSTLDDKYQIHFEPFLANAKKFLDIKDLRVVSDLESKQLFTNHSKIVYGDGSNNLPEHLNGLGYLNILYLLLQIEVKRKYFLDDKKDINLLFIEEPEAHTHPQMQYVFSQKIQEIIREINEKVNLQTFISTHSSHIVSQCNFSDLRYFKLKDGNITIKNFYIDLELKYKGKEEYFKFLKQYLTLYSSELFFAEKIIFIEGTTEKMLLPYFISQYDKSVNDLENKISSQNISIIEVGANSKVFKHFLEFLEIKTLIITDIDTTKLVITPATADKKESLCNPACPVVDGDNTSNYSIKEFLNIPEKTKTTEIAEWFKKLKSNSLHDDSNYIKIAYQIEELGYHGRSFEDSFISLNLKEIIQYKDDGINGIQHKAELVDSVTDFYNLTQKVLKSDGKSEFASSLLFLALIGKVEWKTPSYIKEGLQWIAK